MIKRFLTTFLFCWMLLWSVGAQCAVTNFSVQNAACVRSGLWTAFGSPTVFGGHNLMNALGTDSEVDTVLTGTDVTVTGFGNGCKASIDGGAEVTVNFGGGVSTQTLFTGLTDAAHTVRVKNPVNVFLDQDAADSTHCTFSVTGAAPAISSPSGFGPQTILSGNTYIAKDTGYSAVSNSGYSQYVTPAFAGPSLRFYASCSTVSIWTYSNGQKFRLLIDGVDQATVVSAGSAGRFNWLQIASGLDSATEHLYEVILTTQNATYVYEVMTTGGTGVNASKTPVARKTIAGYGDSITSANAQGYPDTQSSYVEQVGLSKDYNIYNAGLSGSKVQDSGSVRTADITGLSPEVDYCLVLYGTNDFGAGRTTGQFQTDTQTMLQALVNGTTITKFYVLGLLPRTSTTQAILDGYNTAIQNAIAAVTPHTRIIYVDTKAWNMASSAYTGGGSFDSTNFIDGLHPNATPGYLFMKDKLLPLFLSTVQRRRPGSPRTGTRTIGYQFKFHPLLGGNVCHSH